MTPESPPIRIGTMSPLGPWTRRATSALTSFTLIGAAQTAALVALAWVDARAALLAPIAAVYTFAAARSARALRDGSPARAARWVALWTAAAVGGVGGVGATFHAGPLFWWTSAGAVVTWAAASAWAWRRVVRETQASTAAAPAPGEPTATAPASPHGPLQLTEARDAPARFEAPKVRLRS